MGYLFPLKSDVSSYFTLHRCGITTRATPSGIRARIIIPRNLKSKATGTEEGYPGGTGWDCFLFSVVTHVRV